MEHRVKHYKTLSNALLKNGSENIHSHLYHATCKGNYWYQSCCFSYTERQTPTTLILSEPTFKGDTSHRVWAIVQNGRMI